MMIENIPNGIIFLGIIVIGLFIFYVVQFIDMLRSKIKSTEKGLWVMFFIILPIVSAIVWFFAKE